MTRTDIEELIANNEFAVRELIKLVDDLETKVGELEDQNNELEEDNKNLRYQLSMRAVG